MKKYLKKLLSYLYHAKIKAFSIMELTIYFCVLSVVAFGANMIYVNIKFQLLKSTIDSCLYIGNPDKIKYLDCTIESRDDGAVIVKTKNQNLCTKLSKTYENSNVKVEKEEK